MKKHVPTLFNFPKPLIQHIHILRSWESLPSLSMSRSWHSCDKLNSDQTRHLVVYGGHNWVGTTQNPFGDILFLNLYDKNRGWFSTPRVQINKLSLFVNGGLIKRLTAGSDFKNLLYLFQQKLKVNREIENNLMPEYTPV